MPCLSTDPSSNPLKDSFPRPVNRWNSRIRGIIGKSTHIHTHYRTMKSWSLSRSSNFWNREASFAPTFDPFPSEFLWIPLASWQWLKFHSFRIVRTVSRISLHPSVPPFLCSTPCNLRLSTSQTSAFSSSSLSVSLSLSFSFSVSVRYG